MLRILAVLLSASLLISLAACSHDAGSSHTTPCVRDADEPNDTLQSTAFVGQIQDDPGPTGAQDPTEVHRDASLDTTSDVDWFRVTVHDTGIGGDPVVRVIVGDGMKADVWFQCGTGNGTTRCQLGDAIDNDPDYTGMGCTTAQSNGAPPQLTMTTDCANTDTDDGDALIRVTRTTATAACTSYQLAVFAD